MNHAKTPVNRQGELLAILRQAYDRLTDNDMMPPNAALKAWIARAESALDRAEKGAS